MEKQSNHPVPRSVRSEATRRRLCDAASKVLINQGLKNISFVRVCEEAGLSRGAIHHHYASISELLADVTTATYQRLFERASQDISLAVLQKDDLASAIDLLWSHLRSPDFRVLLEIRAAMISDKNLADALAQQNDKVNQSVVEQVLEQYQEYIDENTVRVVFAALTGFALQYFTLERHSPARSEEYAAAFLGSLKDFITNRSQVSNHA